ncbi:hypothetical protein ACFXK0_06255 [Nocardia sp. NPDC059177]|uniref:hypothetical protein n=1 Tax=Nocardia sp. NPDC059177 TaxID=3346759 RepID=UPI0036C54F35
MSTTTRLGLAVAAVAASTSVLLAAPAQASTPGACLVIENNSPNSVHIVVQNYEYYGSSWDIPAFTHAFTNLPDGRKIVTREGTWHIVAPAGTWRYNVEQNWGGECNGTWAYTIH